MSEGEKTSSSETGKNVRKNQHSLQRAILAAIMAIMPTTIHAEADSASSHNISHSASQLSNPDQTAVSEINIPNQQDLLHERDRIEAINGQLQELVAARGVINNDEDIARVVELTSERKLKLLDIMRQNPSLVRRLFLDEALSSAIVNVEGVEIERMVRERGPLGSTSILGSGGRDQIVRTISTEDGLFELMSARFNNDDQNIRALRDGTRIEVDGYLLAPVLFVNYLSLAPSMMQNP